jgi:hypothetical protein
MNPHSLSDEFFGSELTSQRGKREGETGIRARITACRKRVRLNRSMHQLAAGGNQSDEILPELNSAPSQSGQYTEEYAAVLAGRLVEEHEVGTT